MEYREYSLIDRGYRVENVPAPIPSRSLTGLKNKSGSRFSHQGYAYPVGKYVIISEVPGKKVLVRGAGLEGGRVVPEKDVPALLMADYGWPDGTTMKDGLPVRPEKSQEQ